jgi:hypothetical protein
MTYSHYLPTLKQSNITVQDALAALNPTDSLLKDYAIYAGGGGLAGAGVGALNNALRGESKLKGALIGGGVGAGLGAGAKALGDYSLADQKANIEGTKADLAKLRADFPMRTGEGYLSPARSPYLSQFVDAADALSALNTSNTPMAFERRYESRLNKAEQQDLLAALRDSLSSKLGI